MEFTIPSFGTFTAGLRQLKVGEHVYLDGPWGQFRVDPDPRVRVAMIAAGIGVTPMLSMLKTMADGGDRRECVLILGNGTETTIPGRADIEALQGSLNLRVVHVLSEPAAGWSGERGRVGEQVLVASLPGPRWGRGRAVPQRTIHDGLRGGPMKPAQMRIIVLAVSALVVLSCIVWALAVQEIVPNACTYQPPPARAQAFHCR